MRLEDIPKCEHAKRGLEVALAGGHSIQFIGPWQSQGGNLTKWAREHDLKARFVSPCPCGYLGTWTKRECACSLSMISKWQRHKFSNKVRWDITIEIPLLYPDDIIAWLKGKRGEPEEAMMKRVNAAWFSTDTILDDTSISLLRSAIVQLQLSFEQVRNMVAMARTIANLAHAEKIHVAHVAEAVQYRPRKHF